jgi:ABC-type transport system substrate-binding protein
MIRVTSVFCILCLLFAGACSNSPYKKGEAEANTYYTAMSSELQNLDPAISYSGDEYQIVSQIYEPPFQYHYLKRPYEVIPATAEAMPTPVFYDTSGNRLADSDPPANTVGKVEYVIKIKPGIKYAPHPCFAKAADGSPFYAGISFEELDEFDFPSQMPEKGSRELKAADYVLQMYRLADFRLRCPVFVSTFEKYVLGMDVLAKDIETMVKAERETRKEKAEADGKSYNHEQDEKSNPIVLDYLKLQCPGIQLIDELTYKVTLNAKYPQIIYWLAMPFCSPIPQEALDFYNEPAMVEKQFTAKRCPVGTGPYYLDTFKPNEKIVLLKNPNFHEESYPAEGGPGDEEKGLLKDAGERLPFIDKQVWMIEKEPFSSWQKFMQGYYDNSGISEENFDKAIQQTDTGTDLSEDMSGKGIKMHTSVKTVFYELKFNM